MDQAILDSARDAAIAANPEHGERMFAEALRSHLIGNFIYTDLDQAEKTEDPVVRQALIDASAKRVADARPYYETIALVANTLIEGYRQKFGISPPEPQAQAIPTEDGPVEALQASQGVSTEPDGTDSPTPPADVPTASQGPSRARQKKAE
jgi:hypothetical protein